MMRCPACGHEEKIGTGCSRCGTPLSDGEEKAAPSTPSPSQQPVPPPPTPTPKEGKHRSRPLHDLDLTLPELEVQHLESPSPKPQKEPESEKPSFKVTDRRGRIENETVPVQSGPAPKSETGPATGPQTGPRTGGPLDFSSFIFSLGASALMAMGEAQMPGLPSVPGAARPADLAQARELIDLLGLLEEKTKGNLTPEEAELLQQTLYTLRIKFIQASKKT